MNKNMILTADVLDIIFNGRNKAYGAYDLRKTYQQRVLFALMGTVAICLLFFTFMLFTHNKKTIEQPVTVIDYILQPALPDVTKPIKLLPPPLKKSVTSIYKTFANTTPVITPNNLVTKTPLEVKGFDNVLISDKTKSGLDLGDNTIVAPEQGNKDAKNGLSTTNKGDDDVVFKQVEIEAQFPGGVASWMRYLERHLNSNLPSEAGAPIGKYTVYVTFLVDKDGNLSEVVAENNPNYGTAEEAVRVIKSGPKWKPAMQNGHQVAYRVKQAITFIVSDNG